MSAGVKPSSQQIGAIGTKAGYQTSAPQPSQIYVPYEPTLNQSFLQNPSLVQRPASNVAAMLPSSSYYSGSTGQTSFYQTGSTPIQAPPTAPLHQTATPYNITGYSTQTPSANQALGAIQNYTSQMFQQYSVSRGPVQNSLKSPPNMADPGKQSSVTQQDLMNSVFSPVQQMSPKFPRNPSGKVTNTQQTLQQQQQQQQTQSQPSMQKYAYQSVTQANQLVSQTFTYPFSRS